MVVLEIGTRTPPSPKQELPRKEPRITMTTHTIPKNYNAEYIAKRISAMTRRDEYAHVEVNNTTTNGNTITATINHTTLNLTLTPEITNTTTRQVSITPQKEPSTTPEHEALESLTHLIEDIANHRGI